MPIYAFACDACGHAFERLQKLSDADPTKCPVCTEAAVRRQLTAPQFRLAGGGWYETDFKKDGDKKRNLAGDSGETKAAGEGKVDAKPDAKADAKPDVKPAADTKPAASPATSKPAVPATPAKPSPS